MSFKNGRLLSAPPGALVNNLPVTAPMLRLHDGDLCFVPNSGAFFVHGNVFQKISLERYGLLIRLFPYGVRKARIFQGSTGNCSLLAALTAAKTNRPSALIELIQYVPSAGVVIQWRDGTRPVSLSEHQSLDKGVIDASDPGIRLLEVAFGLAHRVYEHPGHSLARALDAVMLAIYGTWSGRLEYPGWSLANLPQKQAEVNVFFAALAAHPSRVLAIGSTKHNVGQMVNGEGFYANHAYAIVRAETDRRIVELRNLNNSTVKREIDFDVFYRNIIHIIYRTF